MWGELHDSVGWQPFLLVVEVVVVVGIVRVPRLVAESVPIIRPHAFFSFLFSPGIVGIPAIWHGEMHSLGADISPACSSDVGIACPCQRIVLLVVIIMVVELVVMARVSIIVQAFAVAFRDIEHVAPVSGLFDFRWPGWRRPDNISRGGEMEEE